MSETEQINIKSCHVGVDTGKRSKAGRGAERCAGWPHHCRQGGGGVPPWGADTGAETWVNWGREPCEDLEEEVSGQKERKAKRFWGRNELGRFEEQQEGQCAWSRVVKQRVVGRGQTQARAGRGTWKAKGRGMFWVRSPLERPLTSEAFPDHPIETSKHTPTRPRVLSMWHLAPAHVFLISLSLCYCLFPPMRMWASRGQKPGLFCSLPHAASTVAHSWHPVKICWMDAWKNGSHWRAEYALPSFLSSTCIYWTPTVCQVLCWVLGM